MKKIKNIIEQQKYIYLLFINVHFKAWLSNIGELEDITEFLKG